ncbi:MAG: right-handed parallel beta-helix repeat-containing protein [archaeon]
MQSNAQGAIEYLLIIGAAILVVAIVILAVTGVLSGGQTQTTVGYQGQEAAQKGLSDIYKESAGELVYISAPPAAGTYQNNTEYKLSSSITTQLTSTSGNNIDFNIRGMDGVTIDCQGKDITQATKNTSTYGIYIYNSKNITIKNCQIKTFYYGVYAEDSNNIILQDSNIFGNSFGIYLYRSNSNNIKNTSFGNSSIAIYFNNTSSSTISESTLLNSSSLAAIMLIGGSNNNLIKNSTITGNNSRAIFITNSNGNVLDNMTISQPSIGISLSTTQNTTIQNSKICITNALTNPATTTPLYCSATAPNTGLTVQNTIFWPSTYAYFTNCGSFTSSGTC